MGSNGHLTIQTALNTVKQSPSTVDPETQNYLDARVREIWGRIQAQPETYVLTKDEFAVFNLYRKRFANPDADKAVRRFWDHYRGDPRDVGLN